MYKATIKIPIIAPMINKNKAPDIIKEIKTKIKK
jgi:hypothetical protein